MRVGFTKKRTGGKAQLSHRDKPRMINSLDGLTEACRPADHHLLLVCRVVRLPSGALSRRFLADLVWRGHLRVQPGVVG